MHSDAPAVYLPSFAITVGVASFPHAARRSHATALLCDSKTAAWQSAVRQVREYMAGATWKRVEPIGEISAAASETLQRMGLFSIPAIIRPRDVCGDFRTFAYHLHSTHGLEQLGINSLPLTPPLALGGRLTVTYDMPFAIPWRASLLLRFLFRGAYQLV